MRSNLTSNLGFLLGCVGYSVGFNDVLFDFESRLSEKDIKHHLVYVVPVEAIKNVWLL